MRMLQMIDCCLCRSLFGNVASLVMLDSASGSSISSIKDGNPVTVTGLESVEGEVLQFAQPVRLLCVCACVCVCVCTCVCVCVCVCVYYVLCVLLCVYMCVMLVYYIVPYHR